MATQESDWDFTIITKDSVSIKATETSEDNESSNPRDVQVSVDNIDANIWTST